ncbi:MAG TPA: PBP1A family penicillin-binding protein [Roseiflexaceae bacterium]|nr:PBP1A family penicillin-binding protein [Roseiflexaceae bacterium]
MAQRTAKYQPRRARPRMTPLRFVWRLFLAFVHITLLGAVLLVAAAIWAYNYYGSDLPDPSAIGQYQPAETTRIYARDGQTVLYELVDPTGGRRTVVPFDRIPQALKDATVAVEDAGFYDNPGVDFRAIVRALLQNYQAQEVVSGGSTITQQLVRGVLLPPEERTRISFERKLREAILAYRVSREFSKEQILGLYLNEVYYGNQAYGVEAAAQAYFGKHVWELSIPEATLIAGLPQSPTTYDPFNNLKGAKARQQITLNQMVKTGFMTPAQSRATFETPLSFVEQTTNLVAPHFVFYVRKLLEERYGPDVMYRGGLRVVTTLDIGWQAEAQRVAREHIAELRQRNATNAGVIMLAPDGQVLAMVGSIDYNDKSIDGEVNVTLAPRQPGSALKPIVYTAAMQRGWTPATVIWDTPVEYPMADGSVYAPHNYDDNWHGPQRLRMALANSLNIPAVKALEFVGVENFVELAHRLGITTLNDPARYGLAMALGAGEVRLLDLTNVYNTFRNGGRRRDPMAILKITNTRGEVLETADSNPGRQVLGPNGEQLAYLITDMLSDNVARQFMFGPGNVMELANGRLAAVKTGTSNEWRDSWAVGYTPDITVGVWVGNSDSSPMEEVAGSNGAGTIWREIMERYNQDRPLQPFPRPTGLDVATICADTGALAGDACPNRMDEQFIAGTQPKTADVTLRTMRVGGDGSCLAASYTPADQVHEQTFIIYPADFHQWAIDAGIPQPPTAFCGPPAPVNPAPGVAAPAQPAVITQPAPNSTAGVPQAFVRGTARGSYTLDFGIGGDPGEWLPIASGAAGVSDGILGAWQTAGLAPGQYTLRLRVTTSDGATVEARTVVQVAPF